MTQIRTRLPLMKYLPLCVLWLFPLNGTLAADNVSPIEGWQLKGQAAMRFLGFKVYDIRLWRVHDTRDSDTPFALELEYAMRFKGADIVERSLDEMRGQGFTDELQLARWRAAMLAVFPDVKSGDRLIGIAVPAREARFYAGERFLGTVADPAFVTAFFDIWLSAKTTAPHVRAALLATDQ